MKTSILSALLLAALEAKGHSIFQQVSVNGAEQTLLAGLRAPSINNPVQDVSSSGIICGASGSTSSTRITAAAGAKIGAKWGHVVGGAYGNPDPDNPIASSHKGPTIFYLAKVSNAASSSSSGLQWFKIGQTGFDTSTKLWGVDGILRDSGYHSYVTLPSCLAPGDYLLRGEIIALHGAYSQGGAQFYTSCAQLTVTGSGTWTGSNFLSFPGAYSATDPGILINIYGSTGAADNGGKAYTPPGGAVQTCPSGSGGGSTPTSTASGGGSTSGSGSAALYGQCGGIGWAGPTACASGTCTVSNAYYSQCLP